MKHDFKTAKLKNGLTVVGEKMPHVNSAAFAFLVPIGAAYDDAQILGASNVLADMFNRGGGKYDSRALSDAFEVLGADRSHNSGIETSAYSGVLLGENLHKIFSIYSDILQHPHFKEEDLANVKELAMQELKYVEDNPSSKVMREFYKHFYPGVFGNPIIGTEEGIKNLDAGKLREFYNSHFVPKGSVIAVSGKFDWDNVLSVIENCFGEWKGEKKLLSPQPLLSKDQNIHVEQDTNQSQIVLGYPSVSIDHPDFYIAKVAAAVLSGGMCGRLFIEVREKRGLVYSVYASHGGRKGQGSVIVYAGTTPERGQETLDVILTELNKLSQGVSGDELNRAKADIKSKLVLQNESSHSRASAIASDWWNLGVIRTAEEIKQAIDAVSNEDIMRHLQQYPVASKTLVTLGKAGLRF